MPTTYEIKIYGKAQNEEFIKRIEDIGKGLGIDGVIYNYKDDSIRILANFPSERKKELFIEFIKELEKDEIIKIEKIEEKELNTFIEFPEGLNRISSVEGESNKEEKSEEKVPFMILLPKPKKRKLFWKGVPVGEEDLGQEAELVGEIVKKQQLKYLKSKYPQELIDKAIDYVTKKYPHLSPDTYNFWNCVEAAIVNKSWRFDEFFRKLGL